jgi:hypothetical protein
VEQLRTPDRSAVNGASPDGGQGSGGRRGGRQHGARTHAQQPQQQQQQQVAGSPALSHADVAAAQAGNNPALGSLLNQLLLEVQHSKQEAAESRMAAAAAQLQLQQAMGDAAAAGRSAPLPTMSAGAGAPAGGLAAAAAAADAARLLGSAGRWLPPHLQHLQHLQAGSQQLLQAQLAAQAQQMDAAGPRRYSLDESVLRRNAAAAAAASRQQFPSPGAASNRSSTSSMQSGACVWMPPGMHMMPGQQRPTGASLDADVVMMQQQHAPNQSARASFEVEMLAAAALGGANSAASHLSALGTSSRALLQQQQEQQQLAMMDAVTLHQLQPPPAQQLPGMAAWPGGTASTAALQANLLGTANLSGGAPVSANTQSLRLDAGASDANVTLSMQQWLAHAQAQAAAASAGDANGGSALSAPQLQTSAYLLQLQQALLQQQQQQQQADAGAAAAMANTSLGGPVSPVWEDMVYAQSAGLLGGNGFDGGLQRGGNGAAGTLPSPLPPASRPSLDAMVAPPGSAGDGGSNHSSLEQQQRQQQQQQADGRGRSSVEMAPASDTSSGSFGGAPTNPCDHLLRNPLGGAQQLGWF